MAAVPCYPWREGNSFELMVDGHCFFPQMLDAMERAQQRIDIELYLVESGRSFERVFGILAAAVSRGGTGSLPV